MNRKKRKNVLYMESIRMHHGNETSDKIETQENIKQFNAEKSLLSRSKTK